MATRPIFVPKEKEEIGVDERLIEFTWHSGFSKTQKQKSIDELHSSAHELGYPNVLEISSKSTQELGTMLSAFNLEITTKSRRNTFTVETAFQGSKVFRRGGPFRDLIGRDSLAAKKDIRLRESGPLTEFNFFGRRFPTEPLTYFYDWLYINALTQNDLLCREVLKFSAFSDIEFNPRKSINCQAHSVALYVSMHTQSKISEALGSPESFLRVALCHYEKQTRNVRLQTGIF